MKLTNKTIVLTGPSSGVGLALLRELGPDNTIVGISRRAPLQEAVNRARRFTHIRADFADHHGAAVAIEEIGQHHPDRIDGLINCAAAQSTPRFTEDDFESSSIAREIAINLTRPIELAAGLLPRLLNGEDPFIMNINSGLALVPKRQSAVYCATKAGLDNFTRGLRAQLSETGIVVQQAFLPMVDTPMTHGRGSRKLSADVVAHRVVRAIEHRILDTDIGKVKLLRSINRMFPAIAHRIMQAGDA